MLQFAFGNQRNPGSIATAVRILEEYGIFLVKNCVKYQYSNNQHFFDGLFFRHAAL